MTGPRVPATPYDTLEDTFGALCSGPRPLALDGREVGGLPDRCIPLDELRSILLHPATDHATRNDAIRVILTRARARGRSVDDRPGRGAPLRAAPCNRRLLPALPRADRGHRGRSTVNTGRKREHFKTRTRRSKTGAPEHPRFCSTPLTGFGSEVRASRGGERCTPTWRCGWRSAEKSW